MTPDYLGFWFLMDGMLARGDRRQSGREAGERDPDGRDLPGRRPLTSYTVLASVVSSPSGRRKEGSCSCPVVPGLRVCATGLRRAGAGLGMPR
jgi:hypothetical protein